MIVLRPRPSWIAPSRVGIFLDRDGVINVNAPPEKKYIRSIAEVEFIPNSLDAIARLTRYFGEQVAIIIVTNQSCVGRGIISEAEAVAINLHVLSAIEGAGGRVDCIYTCPHKPDDGCTCRKPGTGMLQQAVEDYGLKLERSFVVGDHRKDIEMARAVGATSVLVYTGYGAEFASKVKAGVYASNLNCAVDPIVGIFEMTRRVPNIV